MPRPKKDPDEKILNFLSRPLKGEWTSARQLARSCRESRKEIEKFIRKMTDAGIIEGVKDKKSGEYFVRNPWQQSEGSE